MVDTKIQEEILKKHFNPKNDLLRKYSTKQTGSSKFDPIIFGVDYSLNGSSNQEKHEFLPHLEFNVGTYYELSVEKEKISGTIYYEQEGIRLFLNDENNLPKQTLFPTIQDLFYLRNLPTDKSLVSIIQTENDKCLLNIKNMKAEFNFRASSTTYGQIVGHTSIEHPNAELVIKEFLEIIDNNFSDYASLKEHYKAKDKLGERLYEDEGKQSRTYNRERNKLHKTLFDGLEDCLNKTNIKYKTAFH